MSSTVSRPQVVLFQTFVLVVVRIKIGKLDRQDISFWNDIEGLSTVDLLHLNDIIAQSVLPGQLIGLREVVDFLSILKAVIQGQGRADG
jgi:hypothetical protein